jgi:hypothetical protein
MAGSIPNRKESITQQENIGFLGFERPAKRQMRGAIRILLDQNRVPEQSL